MKHSVFIPTWHPTRLNELLRFHWAIAAQRKKRDAATIAHFFRNTPKALGKRRVTLEIVLQKRQRAGDVDAYFKSLLDALVGCGQLIDDNHKHCELAPITASRNWDDWGSRITLEDL